MLEMVTGNVLTPAVLFFVIGLFAAVVKSDLKFPSGLSDALSIYLLISIGLKGGIELSEHPAGEILKPVAGALFLGIAIPIIVLFIGLRIGFDLKNAVGLAACYGSVSIVTYGAAVSFLEASAISFESFMGALVVIMEGPAILVAILLMRMIERKQGNGSAARNQMGAVIRESLFGKSILLLVGSLVIGWICGHEKLPVIKPLFIDLYSGVLILFLLSMGLQAGQHLGVLRTYGLKLLVAGIGFPLLFGTLGVLVGSICELSVGGITLLGVLAGSASYIAAPAALRASVPEANPSIYLGLALGITFPFNLMFGIPIYYHVAQFMIG